MCVGGRGRGVPSGRGWGRHWSCGFTSLSHTRRGIYFFAVVEFCDFPSEPRGDTLSIPTSKPGCPSSAQVWVESLPPTTHGSSSPTVPLCPRKGGGLESGNLCGDTSSVRPLVCQTPPQTLLCLAVPPASPGRAAPCPRLLRGLPCSLFLALHILGPLSACMFQLLFL